MFLIYYSNNLGNIYNWLKIYFPVGFDKFGIHFLNQILFSRNSILKTQEIKQKRHPNIIFKLLLSVWHIVKKFNKAMVVPPIATVLSGVQ